jgi:hypothetical protein
LRTICRSWSRSRRKGTLAAPANLAVMESHSSYFFGSYVPNQGTQINSVPFTANARRGERGGESTFRTVLDAVVAVTTDGPCRQRWLTRSAGRSCEASTPEAGGFVRRSALDDSMREPAKTARQGLWRRRWHPGTQRAQREAEAGDRYGRWWRRADRCGHERWEWGWIGSSGRWLARRDVAMAAGWGVGLGATEERRGGRAGYVSRARCEVRWMRSDD